MSNVEKTMEGSIPNLCFFYFLKVLLLGRACSITAVRKCLIFLIICLCSLLKIQRRDGQPVDEDENYYVKLEGHENHSCDLLKLQ